MEFLRRICYTAEIVAALTLPEDTSSAHYQRARYVEWGKLCYSANPLSSEDYHFCSAVALDCGKDGFLAHAFPPTGPLNAVTVNNVVQKIIADCRRRNINPRKGCAFINAGKEEDLQKLVEDFTKEGIPIKFANTKFAPRKEDHEFIGRSVYFDPRTNTFEVFMCEQLSGDAVPPER